MNAYEYERWLSVGYQFLDVLLANWPVILNEAMLRFIHYKDIRVLIEFMFLEVLFTVHKNSHLKPRVLSERSKGLCIKS